MKYLCAHADWVKFISHFQHKKRNVIPLSRPFPSVPDRPSKCCQGVKQFLFVQNKNRKLRTGRPSYVREEVFFFFWFQNASFWWPQCGVSRRERVLCSESMRVFRWLRARCVRLITPLPCVESFAPFVVPVREKTKNERWFSAEVPVQPSCWPDDPWKRKEMPPW